MAQNVDDISNEELDNVEFINVDDVSENDVKYNVPPKKTRPVYVTMGTIIIVILIVLLYVASAFFSVQNDYNQLEKDYSDLNYDHNNLKNEYDVCMENYSILNENYTELLLNYSSLIQDYTSLQLDYNTISLQYSTLSSDHSSLNANYTALLSSYNTLLMKYNGLLSNHSKLEQNYTSLLENYNDLQLSFTNLEQNYSTLLSDHNALQSDYDTIQLNYINLEQDYNTLLSDYDTLQSEHDILQTTYSELYNEAMEFKNWTLMRHFAGYKQYAEFANYFITPNDQEVIDNTSSILGSSFDGNLTWSDMNTINNWVHDNILYNYDSPRVFPGVYEKYECWQFPNETLIDTYSSVDQQMYDGRGDCEDQSILTLSMFLAEEQVGYAWVALIEFDTSDGGHEGHVTIFLNVVNDKMYIFDPTNGYNLSHNPSADDEPTEIQQYGNEYGWSNINVNMIFNGNEYHIFDNINEFYSYF